MPIAGKGMLLTSMDVPPADEAEFNRWYDSEHLEERVAIPGFLEARRYVAHAGSPKYLCLYSTGAFEDLSSPAYRDKLANQTERSLRNMAKFQNMIRAVARITVSRGTGRGAVLGIVRLRPEDGGDDALRTALTKRLDPTGRDGIISMHLLENDPVLSGPAAGMTAAKAVREWFVLIDGTEIPAVSALLAARFIGNEAPAGASLVSSGIYTLMWDLSKSDLPQR